MNYIVTIFLFPLLIQANEINVEQLTDVTQEIERSVSSPTEYCETCVGELDQETIQKSVRLDQKNIQVSTNYVGGDHYTIALKRTADTPKKVKLKIEYGERVCARTTAYQNPLSGQLGFGCLFWKTEKRTKTVPIDFSKASVLEGDEYQSFRLVLEKDKESRSLSYDLTMTNGLFDIVESHKAFIGLGSTRYEVIRRSGGNRAPAVIPDQD